MFRFIHDHSQVLHTVLSEICTKCGLIWPKTCMLDVKVHCINIYCKLKTSRALYNNTIHCTSHMVTGSVVPYTSQPEHYR
jgi:hypothetical protein